MIAAELAEKINSQAFEKVVATDLTLTFSLINLPFLLKYCKRLSLKKNTMLTKLLANKKMLLIDMSSPNIAKPFSMATYAQLYRR